MNFLPFRLKWIWQYWWGYCIFIYPMIYCNNKGFNFICFKLVCYKNCTFITEEYVQICFITICTAINCVHYFKQTSVWQWHFIAFSCRNVSKKTKQKTCVTGECLEHPQRKLLQIYMQMYEVVCNIFLMEVAQHNTYTVQIN